MNIANVLTGKDHDRIALIDGSDSLTYGELANISVELGETISALVGEGQRIAVIIDKKMEYFIAYFATLLSGNCVVPISPSLSRNEIKHELSFCEVAMVISTDIEDEELAPHAGLLKLSVSQSRLTFQVLKSGKACPNKLRDVAILLPSSGTTSKPKRVMHSHDNILTNATMHIQSLGLSSDDDTCLVLPFGFGYCNTSQIVAHLMLGTKMILFKGLFNPSSFFQLVESHRIRVTTVVPTMLRLMLNSANWNNHDLSSLRYLIVGGSRVTPDLASEFMDKKPTGCRLVQTYGLTEAGPRVTTNIMDDPTDLSVGKALPGVEIFIAGENGVFLGPRETGEIAIKSPTLMLGYFKNETETSKSLRNGLLYTGDHGYLDENGDLFLVGRKKGIVSRGGKKFHVEDVEEVLHRCPAVKECRVIIENESGIDDVLVAEIVLGDGHELQEVIDYCKRNLSPHKIPQKLNKVDLIAKTHTGKTKRY